MKPIETPVLRLDEHSGCYKLDSGDNLLCRTVLLRYFELGRYKQITVRLADAPSRGSTAVQFRYDPDYHYWPTYRVIGWDEHWRVFTQTTNRWLDKNVPILARLKKSMAKKTRSVTLHVTVYLHDGGN